VRYAVALSQHPDTGAALGEVVGQILDRIGPAPDAAILFMTGNHASQSAELGRTIHETLGARCLVGSSATSIIAQRQEIEESAGLVLWAGHTGPVKILRPSTPGTLPDNLEKGTTILLLADPFSYDAVQFVRNIPAGLTVIGGLASSGTRRGENRLLINQEVQTQGAVALALPPELGIRPLVSQGCRPIGEAFTVTSSSNNLLQSLGGRPAFERLEEIVNAADPSERTLLTRGLHIGLVVNEQQETFDSGDFLIRGVLGVERSTGAIAIGDHAPIGSTVQFQVRDAQAALFDLQKLTARWRAESALVFTCNGRGSRLFGRSGADAETFVESLETTEVAGMFCAGEIGPIGARHFLHGFTASALLFGAERSG